MSVMAAEGSMLENHDTTHEEDRGDHAVVPGWLVLIVIVLILGIAGMVAALAFTPVVKRVADAKHGRLEVGRWQAQVAQRPNDPQAHLGLAFAYQKAGVTGSALSEYDRALQLRPGDPAAMYNKGAILLSEGQTAEGEKGLWRVLKNDPGHVLAAEALGAHYASKKRWDLVLKAVRPAAAVHPEFADLHYYVGLGSENLGDLRTARDEYAQALRFAPDMSKAAQAFERVSNGQ